MLDSSRRQTDAVTACGADSSNVRTAHYHSEPQSTEGLEPDTSDNRLPIRFRRRVGRPPVSSQRLRRDPRSTKRRQQAQNRSQAAKQLGRRRSKADSAFRYRLKKKLERVDKNGVAYYPDYLEASDEAKPRITAAIIEQAMLWRTPDQYAVNTVTNGFVNPSMTGGNGMPFPNIPDS